MFGLGMGISTDRAGSFAGGGRQSAGGRSSHYYPGMPTPPGDASSDFGGSDGSWSVVAPGEQQGMVDGREMAVMAQAPLGTAGSFVQKRASGISLAGGSVQPMSGLTDIQMASNTLAATVGAWDDGIDDEPASVAQWGNALEAIEAVDYDNFDEQGGLFDSVSQTP